VIVVTLWTSTAKLINQRRDEGLVGGTGSYLLCAIPFAKRWVNLLADYVLHNIHLETLLSRGQGEGERKEEEKVNDNDKEEREEREARENKKEEETRTVVKEKNETNVKEWRTKEIEGKADRLRERVLDLIKESGGIQPCVIAERLGLALPRVSEAVRRLVAKGLVKVTHTVPDLASPRRANSVYYLDASKPTALHDVVMNEIWMRNMELGGRSRDFSFEYCGRSWHTDGLLENTSGRFILEVVAGEYDDRILGQLEAYSTQLGHRGITGVIVVVLRNECLERIRREVTSRRTIKLGGGLLITLRSRDEKLQFTSLLLGGQPVAYHQNPTS